MRPRDAALEGREGAGSPRRPRVHRRSLRRRGVPARRGHGRRARRRHRPARGRGAASRSAKGDGRSARTSPRRRSARRACRRSSRRSRRRWSGDSLRRASSSRSGTKTTGGSPCRSGGVRSGRSGSEDAAIAEETARLLGAPESTEEAARGLSARLLPGGELTAWPLRDGPHRVGLLAVAWGAAPSRAMLAAGAEAAGPLALALGKARLFEANRERLATLLALHETGVDLGSSRDRDALLRSIVDRAQGLVHGTMAGLYLKREDGKLELVLASGVLATYVGVVLAPGEGVAGTVAATQRADPPRRLPDVAGPRRPSSRPPASARSSACRSSGGGRSSEASSSTTRCLADSARRTSRRSASSPSRPRSPSPTPASSAS